jgi:cytochrome c biogenesis protein CcmG/thiol:disulfide interchange protein DsbE
MRREGGLVATLALALLLAACGCGGDDGDVAGGAVDLPGPVPEGVVYATPPETALAAPDFSAELVDGTPVRASELWAERPVVLVFTASWCERCANLHRDVADAVDEHGDGLALLGIVPEDDAEAARDYADELDLGRPLAAASDRVWLDYAAREPPVVVLVSRGGKVLRGWAGDVDREVLERRLGELVGGAT